MTGQTWLAYTLAGVMLVTAAYCVARLVISWQQRRQADQQADGVHVLMGVAMAGMLVPTLRVFWADGWEVVFGAAAVWFGWQTMREYRSRVAAGWFRPHHVQHAVACAAMVYMFAAVTTAAGTSRAAMSGMSGAARWPALALIFALALFGQAAWTVARLPARDRVSDLAAAAVPVAVARALSAVAATGVLVAPASPVADPGLSAAAGEPAPRPAALPLSPRLAACCEIAMGVVMSYALILML